MDFLKEIDHIFTCVTKEELKILHNLSKNKKVGIEIGSYLGASSYAIASSNIDKLFCIDVWKSNIKMRPDPKKGTLYDNFFKNTKKYSNKIQTIKDYSYNAIDYFKERNIKADFLFIDGDHSLEGVTQDWELYYPILRKGAIVIFHDWGWGSIKKVIEEKVMSKTEKYQNLPNMWWATIK